MILWNDNSLASNTCYAYAVNHGKKKKGKRKSWLKQQLKNCMAKNDFRVTSILKIIIRICMKNVEFCGKTSLSFYSKDVCLFIFCIFYLNEKELNQQVCLIKYAENEIRKREREEQKHIQLQKYQF